MPIRPIVTIPNDILTTETKKVIDINSEIEEVVKDLKDTLLSAKEPEGAGLAATQIGSTKRICVVRKFYPNPENPEETISKEYVLVNPKIISTSKDTDTRYEGCLSVPDTYGKVERFKKIKVKALDEKGEPVRITATGFFGRTIQHEIDHLDGILFTSKVEGKTLTEHELDSLEDEQENL